MLNGLARLKQWALVKRMIALAIVAASVPVACESMPFGGDGLGTPLTKGGAGGQTWAQETLSNGLKVVYAPMPNTPAVHVRVVYRVGSRDERPDRQGFAHMFEHMMFRGSEHVKPEEHMRLINMVGGYSNAFTSFDQTVYLQTLPANYSEMALWLEADRMASFKVSQTILETEREVVGEEYRLRANRPYGTMWDELMPAVFKQHPYRWTPIGNMEQLKAAHAPELQEFFNKYYMPNNAILLVAGNIDIAKTRSQVHRYFGWIPEGKSKPAGTEPLPSDGIVRNIPKEPKQTEARRLEVKMVAPLARIVLAYHMPRSDTPDGDAFNLMLTILGDGQSSRLYKALVTNENPLCTDAGALAMFLEDGGVMGASATLLSGKDVSQVERVMRAEIAKMRDTLVTAEELEKVKQQNRHALAQRFETAESTAEELGNSMLTFGQLKRVTEAQARLEAVTPQDIQRVAREWLNDSQSTAMIVTPTPPAQAAPAAAAGAPVAAAAAEPVEARVKAFPEGYPTRPPMTGKVPDATFEKGTATTVALSNGVPAAQVIVMNDRRMPIVNWNITLRAGGHVEPAGKEGLASLTAEMVRRGPKGKSFDQFNEELESRAISLDVSDGGDYTRISGSCLKEQFGYAGNATMQMLLNPAFDEGEFQRLKEQMIDSLRVSLNNPQTIASRALTKALYGNSALGRLMTLESLAGITLDDVKKYYASVYRADGAILMVSGDIAVQEGQKVATGWVTAMPTGNLPKPTYDLPAPAQAARIILVDRPESQQSSIRMGIRAYSIESDEKFAGSLANQILSSGIESRLGRYVRAEKGYVYSVQGIFSPSRQAGAFVGQTDTRFATTADTVQAMYKVFEDMRKAPVGEQELADAKFRVAGALLMSMETVTDQAARRVEGLLNRYPIDYYDKYAQRIGQVSAEQIKDVMNKYVIENRMTVVVVGPATTLKPQLEKLGPVEVVAAR